MIAKKMPELNDMLMVHEEDIRNGVVIMRYYAAKETDTTYSCMVLELYCPNSNQTFRTFINDLNDITDFNTVLTSMYASGLNYLNS